MWGGVSNSLLDWKVCANYRSSWLRENAYQLDYQFDPNFLKITKHPIRIGGIENSNNVANEFFMTYLILMSV